jgi:undecaprenyl-diphosphatase
VAIPALASFGGSMPILHAIILGIVQGLSEFLPISSSGHLLVVPWLFEWDDFAGNASLEKTFDVALHIGTLVGLVAYFWRDLVRLAVDGLTKPKSREGKLAWWILASMVPAAITGALFSDTIEEDLGQIWLIGVMLIVFGLVLAWADKRPGGRAVGEVRFRDVMWMGAGQAIALQPGVSRSGVTMTAGRVVGLDRDASARIAFLMSVPVTAGAVAFKALDAFGPDGTGIPDGFAPAFLWGILAAAITGWVAVWGTLKLVRNHSFMPFVVYRLVAGTAILLIYVCRG